MRTLGVYLVFAAVVLRTAVVLSIRPEFPVVMTLLAGYGLLLFGRMLLSRRTSTRQQHFTQLQITYLSLQSILVIAALTLSSYEDFLALLFIPLSLDAVSFFGRRAGFAGISIFSLAMIATLLFSDVGPLFGLAMGILYSGICFLFGGYAHQVQKAETARLHNQRTFHELEATHRQLQGYAYQRTNLAIEHERMRLARELHDSVTQTVFSMNLAAQSARLLWNKDFSRAAEQLLRIEELAASGLLEIQSLVSQLSPRSIVEEGLPTALHRLAAQKARDGFQVSVEIQKEGRLSESVARSLYFIVHEALVNVSKHSGTCQATVRLNINAEHSRLEIEDRGRGFNPQAALGQRGHFGLDSMYERAHEIEWNLSVLSRPGQGTRILVTNEPSGGLP
jgi:signal transduction histidine kinase